VTVQALSLMSEGKVGKAWQALFAGFTITQCSDMLGLEK
jgi:hypothetical protein